MSGALRWPTVVTEELSPLLEQELKQPTAIDLFSGAGGLTAGLETAGWRTIAAVDSDPDCVASLEATKAAEVPIPGGERTYLHGTKLVCSDIAEVDAIQLRPHRAGPNWRPDLLAGGPPCQPFSSSGRQKGVSDPRGELFREFVRVADELRPRLVLFENVRGLITAKSPDGEPGGVLRLIQESFEDIGYACRFELINAADFGAAQRRVRLFMVAACDRELPTFPDPTHSEREVDELFTSRKKWVSLREFLSSQPRPKLEDIVRPTERREKELAELKPGTGIRAAGIVEANRPGGHWGYRQDCFLADPSVPSRTIRAASTPDWIRQRGGKLRRLTWRECAGLQGFPSDWRFVGTKASRFRQIGNAVQSDVAREVGRALASSLSSRRRAAPESPPWPAYFGRKIRYTAMEHRVNGRHRIEARSRGTGSQ